MTSVDMPVYNHNIYGYIITVQCNDSNDPDEVWK